MHWLCGEVFYFFAYNTLPVNPLKADHKFLDWGGAEGEGAQVVGAFMRNTSSCDDFAHWSASNGVSNLATTRIKLGRHVASIDSGSVIV